jgi:gag-polyprotein putative aspartyl protease
LPSIIVPASHLQDLGPVIEIEVAVSALREAELRAAGDEVPDPIAAAALADTGASHTVIQQNLAVLLGIQPVGVSTYSTASSANILCPRYEVRLLFPHDIVFEATVAEAPLPGQQIQCLIGRDILSRAVLVYLGESNLFSLSF